MASNNCMGVCPWWVDRSDSRLRLRAYTWIICSKYQRFEFLMYIDNLNTWRRGATASLDILCTLSNLWHSPVFLVRALLARRLILYRTTTRLNILSLALSWALWCCLCCTHMIFNRVEPPLKASVTVLFHRRHRRRKTRCPLLEDARMKLIEILGINREINTGSGILFVFSMNQRKNFIQNQLPSEICT